MLKLESANDFAVKLAETKRRASLGHFLFTAGQHCQHPDPSLGCDTNITKPGGSAQAKHNALVLTLLLSAGEIGSACLTCEERLSSEMRSCQLESGSLLISSTIWAIALSTAAHVFQLQAAPPKHVPVLHTRKQNKCFCVTILWLCWWKCTSCILVTIMQTGFPSVIRLPQATFSAGFPSYCLCFVHLVVIRYVL